MRESKALEVKIVFLTCESEAELLCSDVIVIDPVEQRLHLDYEQIWTVQPSFGHRADILQKDVCEQRIIVVIASSVYPNWQYITT